MFKADRAGSSPAIGSYADDVMVMATNKCPDAAARLVQLALRQAEWWSSTWKLPLQPTKCTTIVFSRKYVAPTVRLYLDGAQLEVVNEAKYLGVNFDRKLNFRRHFREVVTTAERRGYVEKT